MPGSDARTAAEGAAPGAPKPKARPETTRESIFARIGEGIKRYHLAFKLSSRDRRWIYFCFWIIWDIPGALYCTGHSCSLSSPRVPPPAAAKCTSVTNYIHIDIDIICYCIIVIVIRRVFFQEPISGMRKMKIKMRYSGYMQIIYSNGNGRYC